MTLVELIQYSNSATQGMGIYFIYFGILKIIALLMAYLMRERHWFFKSLVVVYTLITEFYVHWILSLQTAVNQIVASSVLGLYESGLISKESDKVVEGWQLLAKSMGVTSQSKIKSNLFADPLAVIASIALIIVVVAVMFAPRKK